MNSKSFSSAFLTAILIGGLVLASAMRFGTVQASTGDSGIPKPSVPEFTVELIDNSYDVPATHTVDPYTGADITHPGYRVENKAIRFTIKNESFTPYLMEGTSITWGTPINRTINRYYNIRTKGHFAADWTELFTPSGEYPSAGAYPQQDYESQYTVVFYSGAVPSEGQMDFQVQALIGSVDRADPPDGSWLQRLFAPIWAFNGEKSDWSDTQTLIIGESQTPTPSPAATPTPTPTPSEEPLQTEQIEPILGAAIVVAVIVVGAGLLTYLTKRK